MGWGGDTTVPFSSYTYAPFLLLPNSLLFSTFSSVSVKVSFSLFTLHTVEAIYELITGKSNTLTTRKFTVTTLNSNKGFPLVFNLSVD